MTRKDLDFSWETAVVFSKDQLKNFKKLCGTFNHPEDKLKCIHVTGTNGKGSVCSMLNYILQNAGYKVGVFTSPPLEGLNDQIKINNQKISDEDIISLEREIRDHVVELNKIYCWTEIITLIAFEYFARNNCDIVIIEAVIGGEIDPTNVINAPALSIITRVGMDHMKELGGSLEQITLKKAGIIKNNCPILFGDCSNLISKNIIMAKANEMDSKYYEVDLNGLNNISYSLDSTKFDFNDYKNIELNLLGTFQLLNAATAITAIEILQSQFDINSTHIYNGLKSVVWKSRFEIINNNPLIIFDGGHNSDAIQKIVESIEVYSNDKPIYILLVAFRRKDYPKMAEELSKLKATIFLYQYNRIDSMPPNEFKSFFKHDNIKIFKSLEDAFIQAKKEATDNDGILICSGAFSNYIRIKKLLGEKGYDIN